MLEVVDEAAGELGAEALDGAARQVALQAAQGAGVLHQHLIGLELAAELGVGGPAAGHGEVLAFNDVPQGPHHDGLAPIGPANPRHREGAVLGGVGEADKLAFEAVFGH